MPLPFSTSSPSPPLRPFAERLLAWYDAHARVLAWRVGPQARAQGARPVPYHVYLSEIMLQQTTVATVTPYFQRFVKRWPSITALAGADVEDVMAAWAGLGYYSRARNLHAAARQVVAEFGGALPSTETELLQLKGVGAYTAAAIAAIAFDQRAVVIDGNVERVLARHSNLRAPLATIKPQLRALAQARTPDARTGDYAQAMMDLGATLCTPRQPPQCLLCPVRDDCQALAHGNPAALPVKAPKPTKPARRALALVIVVDGTHVLLRRNPAKGLLGGMLGFPTTPQAPWQPEPSRAGDAKARYDDWANFPRPDAWSALAGKGRDCAQVFHTFTHFHLTVMAHRVDVPTADTPIDGELYAIESLDALALPTLMRKVWHAAANNP